MGANGKSSVGRKVLSFGLTLESDILSVREGSADAVRHNCLFRYCASYMEKVERVTMNTKDMAESVSLQRLCTSETFWQNNQEICIQTGQMSW